VSTNQILNTHPMETNHFNKTKSSKRLKKGGITIRYKW